MLLNRDFPEGLYTTIALDRLMLFAARNIMRNGEECTFERLVKECFTLFPKSFALYRYPEWPDSNKLDRPLRTLREKGMIAGNPRIGFKLTDFGQKVADEVEHELRGEQLRPELVEKPLKGRERILIGYLKKSNPYTRFLKDRETFSPSEAELRALLRCTLETPPRVVKQNLALAKRLAEDCGEWGILEFLNACEQTSPIDSP